MDPRTTPVRRLETFPDAATFFDEFVSRRRPCAVNAFPPGVDRDSLGDEGLAAMAGDARVRVEHRADTRGHFGHGVKKDMLFGDLVASTRRADGSLHYMTTQDVPDIDGRPGVPSLPFAEPVASLVAHGAVPPRLAVLGNLVPYAVNAWFGGGPAKGARPTSTGLHVDFHDNVYVLLRGRKRFTLYSPRSAEAMHTYGKITRAHRNGLLNFAGSGTTREDGADPSDVRVSLLGAAEERVAVAERRVAALEARGASARKDLDRAMVDLDEAEKAHEALLDAELDAAFGGDGPGSDDEPFGGGVIVDDFDDFDDFDDGDGYGDDDSGDERVPGARRGCGGTGENGSRGDDADNSGRGGAAAESKVGFPDNFSQVDRRVASDDAIRERFPDFPLEPDHVVEIVAGQCLYLPAGYFHAVESFPTEEDGGGHFAVNYWVYPPVTGATFNRPYTDDHWQRLWRTMVQRYRDETGRDLDEMTRNSQTAGARRTHRKRSRSASPAASPAASEESIQVRHVEIKAGKGDNASESNKRKGKNKNKRGKERQRR